jgi:hypothetical protein
MSTWLCGITNKKTVWVLYKNVGHIKDQIIWMHTLEHTKLTKKTNSMVWVRERTIPAERPPLVGEVGANSCGASVPRCQRDGSLRPYSRFSRQEPLLFYQVAPQLYSRGWLDPVPDPLHFSGSAGNRTRASGSVAKNSDHYTTDEQDSFKRIKSRQVFVVLSLKRQF